MFNKKVDLSKLSMLTYSIDVELNILSRKLNEISKLSNNQKKINELDLISQNLQTNIQNLKLLIEFDDDEIELLDVEYDSYDLKNVYNRNETEILSDLTKEIEILDDDLYKTELLDDLSTKANTTCHNKEKELDKLKYLENTITLNLKEVNDQFNSLLDCSDEVKQINDDLNNELNDINDKIKKRIKVLKMKKNIFSILIIIFTVGFVLITTILIIRFLQGYKVNNEIKNLEKYVTEIEVSSENVDSISDEQYYKQAYENVFDIETNSNYENNDYYKYIGKNVLSIDFDELFKINSETIGWIRVENTNVNYPFVQSNDNFYYLKHSYDKTSSYMGWIFMDYRNNSNFLDRNTIIYGHGLINNTMFGSLRDTYEEEWYKNKDNQIIKIYTDKGFLLYQLFSIYTIEPEDYYITTNFSSDWDYRLFLNTIENRSIYDFDVEISVEDKILTLSTCYNNDKRAVLHSKLLYKSY